LRRARFLTRRAALVDAPIAIVVDAIPTCVWGPFGRKLVAEAGIAILILRIHDSVAVIVDAVSANLRNAFLWRQCTRITIFIEGPITIIVHAITGRIVREHGRSVAGSPLSCLAHLVALMTTVVTDLGLPGRTVDVHARVVLTDGEAFLEGIHAALRVRDASPLTLAFAIRQTDMAVRTITGALAS
jgi:hypothetical protein